MEISVKGVNAANMATTPRDMLKKAGLRVNPEKCSLIKKEVKYLGHIIDKNGVGTDPAKTEAV